MILALWSGPQRGPRQIPRFVSGIFPRLNSDVRVTFSHHIRRNKFDYSHTCTIITLLVSLNSELGDMNHRRRTTSRSVWNLTALHVCMLRFYIGTVSRLPYLLILMFKLEYVEYHQLVNVVIISLACRASRVWIYSNPLSFITLSFGNAYLLSLLLS